MKLFFRSFREIFFFSLPIITGQVGQMLFGIGDIIVAGRHGTVTLSALGIATAIISPFLIIGLGITYVISPLKAKALAEQKDISSFLPTSLLLAFIVGILLSLILLSVNLNLHSIGFAENLSSLIEHYISITLLSVIPALLFQVLKENLQAYEKTFFPNALIIFFNGFNVVANIICMFYYDLGIRGAALATLLSRSLMALILFLYTQKQLSFKGNLSKELLWQFFKKGIPVGFGGVVTAAVFSVVTILVGKISLVASAANNIIITISSVTYMIPYALASASSVKVGKKCGEKKFHEIVHYGGSAILLGAISALCMGLLFITIPNYILAFATKDHEVIQYGSLLLFVVALYQIPDTIQCVLMGSLRGMGVTFRPMLYSLVGVWGIGFPIGFYLAYKQNMGALGLWSGLAIGLTFMAIILLYLFFKVVKEHTSEKVDRVVL